MYRHSVLTSSFLIFMLSGCGSNGMLNPNAWNEESCVKYPTPDARADCVRRIKEAEAAFEKQKQADERRQRALDGGQSRKANDLCFTRQSTGEVVCPN